MLGAKHVSNPCFQVRRISFNTSRGGQVPGDAVYNTYDVVFQDAPSNLKAEGYPTVVCNQGQWT